MCGIAFSFNQERSSEHLNSAINNALNKLAHRGPNDSGVISGSHWVMGHRRLAIIDLAGSQQPISDPQRRFHLSFNGEIYNYKDLRANLARDWNFITTGDTEVLLAGLILHGSSFLTKLEGMWAFALWDSVEKKLILSRDRLGKKPLYFTTDSSALSCASELPALNTLAENTWSEDPDGVADYLRYGFYAPGFTAYDQVLEVLPGHIATWSPGNELKQSHYWKLSINTFEGDQKAAAKAIRETLIQAVSKRLVADVEVGAFLSGGIDSSIIAAIITKELGHPLKTFTIGFSDPSYDESHFARAASQILGTDHYEERFPQWDGQILESLLLKKMGQPFADASLLPTSLVSHTASQQISVVLSGDGGDEIFCGYQRYHAMRLLSIYRKLPLTARNVLHRTVRALPEPNKHHSRSLLRKANLFLDITEADIDYYVAPAYFSTADLTNLAPTLATKGRLGLYGNNKFRNSTQQMMITDINNYLPQDILAKVDRASMAHGIEARAPFLDHQLIELAFSLPPHWHMSGTAGKQMLRRAFEDLLPKNIWQRRKQGFSVPLHQWFRGTLDKRLIQWAEEIPSAINTGELSRLIAEHRSGARNHGQRLWLLYVYFMFKNSQQINCQ